ncbi:MAG: hypothetical protein HY050_02800 [Actinobacteria bacterium]|nr:hypothetical protein [Actinomycetota bacterium]
MESLAVLVTVLLISATLSGPIALALTYLRVKSKSGKFAKRTFITLFAMWGALTALQFAISNLSFFPRIMGVAGVSLSIYALKREFFTRSEK